jgi:PiT family inorganic phosphate transporter
MSGGITDKAGIPLWIMAVGALGIAIGLGLYGPRLIRTVGGEITELDQMRAYSIAMAAALTVIIASQLGLPVSTTHIAIGGVFGVGFLREWLDESNKIERQIDREKAEIKDDKKMLNALRGELKKLEKKPSKTVDEYQRITELYRLIDEEESALKKAKKVLKKEKKNLFVKRDMVKKIVTAWVVTVPAAATLSACIFFMIRGIML